MSWLSSDLMNGWTSGADRVSLCSDHQGWFVNQCGPCREQAQFHYERVPAIHSGAAGAQAVDQSHYPTGDRLRPKSP